MSGYAVDSLADSASKQSLDSARKMITTDKAAMQDHLDIAHGIRQVSQNSARESARETADDTEGTKGWFKPDSARSHAQIDRLTDRPSNRPNRYFNVGVSSSVNELHSRVHL